MIIAGLVQSYTGVVYLQLYWFYNTPIHKFVVCTYKYLLWFYNTPIHNLLQIRTSTCDNFPCVSGFNTQEYLQSMPDTQGPHHNGFQSFWFQYTIQVSIDGFRLHTQLLHRVNTDRVQYVICLVSGTRFLSGVYSSLLAFRALLRYLPCQLRLVLLSRCQLCSCWLADVARVG